MMDNIITRTSKLLWKNKSTQFELINAKSLYNDNRPLGGSVRAHNIMMAADEEMKMLLPEILGISVNSDKWHNAVSEYWHNIFIDVPKLGKTLDLSLIFDPADPRRATFIGELAKTLKIENFNDAESVKKVLDYIDTKVPENFKFRYVHPVNVEEYLVWRYALESAEVANSHELSNKTDRIRFYLTNEEQIKKEVKLKNQRANKAVEELMLILKDKEQINNALIGLEIINDVKSLAMDEQDKLSHLRNVAFNDPARFLTVVKDKFLSSKVVLYKYQFAGLIRKLPNTSIFVDATNPETVLGNSMDDAISFLKTPDNKAYANELELKFKQLMK